jgi:hypothetical protein
VVNTVIWNGSDGPPIVVRVVILNGLFQGFKVGVQLAAELSDLVHDATRWMIMPLDETVGLQV